MNRREALTLAALSLVTIAVGTPLGLLVYAATVGRVQWAEAGFCGIVTVLALLVPAMLVLLLRAARLSVPDAARVVRAGAKSVRARVHDWREWRGIQLAAETPRRPTPDTMAVRPRTVHVHAGRHAAGGAP